jgi:hypothetical protein
MYATDTTTGTADLARYSTPVAFLVAVLVILELAVQILAMPLRLAVLVTDRAARRLDRWLAALPLPPQPDHPIRAHARRGLVASLPG